MIRIHSAKTATLRRDNARRWLRAWSLVGCCAAPCAALAGCGRGPSPHCQPVRGQVLVEGKPAAEAAVVFHPATPIPDWSGRPRAFTDAEGRFALTTDKANDGAPSGEYLVTVELRAPRQVGEDMVRDGAHLLPERYRRPNASGLKAIVVEGANELPPFALKKK